MQGVLMILVIFFWGFSEFLSIGWIAMSFLTYQLGVQRSIDLHQYIDSLINDPIASIQNENVDQTSHML